MKGVEWKRREAEIRHGVLHREVETAMIICEQMRRETRSGTTKYRRRTDQDLPRKAGEGETGVGETGEGDGGGVDELRNAVGSDAGID